MRALFAVVLVGCFAPSPPAGAPCDPAAPTCPGGQACAQGVGGFFCGVDPVGADARSNDAPTELAIDAGIDAGSDAAIVTHFELPANVAECVDPTAPDPAVCRSANGGALKQMVVDINDSAAMNPWDAYIRFNADSFGGRTIKTVTLRVFTTDDPKAAGDSGEVFTVAPFVLADLTGTAPAKMGARLAPSKGTIPALTTVNFALPITSVTAGNPTHLGIFPKGGSGVNYWNIDGTDPPKLIVDTF